MMDGSLDISFHPDSIKRTVATRLQDPDHLPAEWHTVEFNS